MLTRWVKNRLFDISKVGFFFALAVLPILSFAETEPASKRFGLGEPLEEKKTTIPRLGERPPTFYFDMNEWNEMRRAVEEGRTPGVEIEEVAVSTEPVVPPAPPPGQISFELPYESSLSVTGRKVIKVEIENTHITKERAEELGSAQDTQSFNMEQELQARIQGTVARKTTINVNFDDTKENVKDFSVIYKGDPDEVVQEAAFGDIVLSLPATEFVNYNKQLFGIRTALKYKRAGFMAIGSRTKGTTETKRFTGSTKRQQVFVNDTEYIQRRYYDLTFSTASAMSGAGGVLNGLTILPLSDAVPEIVYAEETTGLVPFPQAQDYQIATPTAPAAPPLTIRMRQLSRGVDYSIDRLTGIITFTNEVSADIRIAIDFTLNNGQRLSGLVGGGNPVAGVLIKDKSPEAPEVSQEIKRFYSAKSRNIVPDNGLGNFLLVVMDKNRESEIGDTLSPIQRYPDTIDMNFELGIFELQNRLPFAEVYASNVNRTSPLQAVFRLEYNSVVRTYTLKPNIVLQSERVEVNGRKLVRDLDYYIDYDIGIITFFNDDLIRESSVIEVTYEFAPFGGQLGETLVGGRATYDILENQKVAGVGVEKWSAGSTVLYNFAAKPTGPPDIRSTPSSLLVTEGDTRVDGLTIGGLPLKTNLAIEAARSDENPNLFGKALIDSMEGIKQEDNASMLEDSWQAAALPQTAGFNEVADFRGRENGQSHIRWVEADVSTIDPNDGDATQKALSVSYDLNTKTAAVNEQAAIVSVLSFSGRDFSKKTTLEVELQGAGVEGQNVDLWVEYGTFNEDSDKDGLLDTEDKIPFDGVLNLGEDIGWEFNGPGDDLLKSSTGDNVDVRVGQSNTRLDSEDLNGDRVLSTQDTPATFQPLFRLSDGVLDVVGNASSDLSFTGRRLFQIPLNVPSLSPEEQGRMTAVRQVRVTIRNLDASTPKSGNIVLARLSIVGNTWEPAEVFGAISSTMTVRAINNKDDAGVYTTVIGHPDYNDLYKGATPTTEAREQALALTYDLAPGSSATTRNTFSAPRDFSRHDEFKVFVSKRDSCGADCGTLFFQAGSETEYQMFSIPVSEIPTRPIWGVIRLEQRDGNNDGIPESWVASNPNVTVTRVGAVPSLTQISQLKAGIINTSGAAVNNEVWLNEIHLGKPHEREGHAKRYTFDTSWTNWMDFGGTYRNVDRHFQTPTTAITNQDHIQSSAFANFNRIRILPMTFKTSTDETITPSAFRTNQNALVSFLEEGSVKRTDNAATAKLLIPKLPVFDFNYDDSKTVANLTRRTDLTHSFRIAASYSPPVKPDLLPGKRLTLRLLPTSITYSHTYRVSKVRFRDATELALAGISTAPFSSTNVTQYATEDDARMAFSPWDGFNFNPSYYLKVEEDERNFRPDEIDAAPQVGLIHDKRTPKSLTQTIRASGNLRILKWLDPRYNYSFSGTETNELPTLSNATGYMLKTITRTGEGEVSGSIQVGQVVPFIRILKTFSVNPSYKIENGDTYKNMPEDFEWRNNLWVGNKLDVSTGTNAQRTDATSRKTFRASSSWLPFSAYSFLNPRIKPLSSISMTNNFQSSIEDRETTGTNTHIESVTWPDLIMTINDTEDFFGQQRVIDNSRLTLKSNTKKSETTNISRSKTEAFGSDYLFQFMKKLDFSTSFNISHTKEENLVSNQLTNKTKTRGYSIQTGIPWRVWRFTPRYDRNETDARDSVRITNDLVTESYSVQIYGDATKPLGLRLGRTEFGLENRLILNSTIRWEKKRSSVNPSTNYLDTYSATMSGDYTISKNFRLAIGGNFSQEKHHPDFKKLDQFTFGINSTLTIQF